MAVQYVPVIQLEGIEVENRRNVFLGRNALGFILEDVDAPKIQLLAGDEVAEAVAMKRQISTSSGSSSCPM
jgi:hypothetical protein